MYSLLLSPKYRVIRYTLLGISLFIFAYSESIYHYPYEEVVPFVLLLTNSFLCKAIVVTILLTILLPLLLKQRYAIFWISVFVVIITVVWMQQVVIEGMIYKHFRLPFWKEHIKFWYIIIDLFSQNAIWFLFTLGILMGRLFKYWTKEFEHKQQIQASQLQMETELMKEQVSPSFLCKTLHKSGEFALTTPEKASDMLMQLSRLLHYQLYDCRHEKVLLDSEIHFLNRYLSILKYSDEHIDFNITVSGQTIGIMIPPLLFVPFLQFGEIPSDTDTSRCNPIATDIDIKIMVRDNQLTFDLTNHIAFDSDTSIRQRLEQLYPQKHSLKVEPNHVLLTIQIQ